MNIFNITYKVAKYISGSTYTQPIDIITNYFFVPSDYVFSGDTEDVTSYSNLQAFLSFNRFSYKIFRDSLIENVLPNWSSLTIIDQENLAYNRVYPSNYTQNDIENLIGVNGYEYIMSTISDYEFSTDVHTNFTGYSATTTSQINSIQNNITVISGTTQDLSSYTAQTVLNTSHISYISGVTDTKLNNTIFNTFTGTTLPTNYYNKTQINTYTGTTLTLIGTKQNTITGAATTITTSNLTTNRALISNASGKIGVSTTTSTELGYVAGVTSAIQTQLNSKAPLISPALTGTPTAPTAAIGTNTTQIATTAYYISSAANANPLMDGTVAIGTSTRFARQDHVHPNDTTKVDKLTGATNCLGVFDAGGNIVSSNVTLGQLTGGTGYYVYGENETPTSTTSTTPQLFLTATGTLTAGTFALDFTAVIGNNTKNRAANVQYYLDGSPLSAVYAYAPANGGDVTPVPYMKDIALTAGSHTFEVYYFATSGTALINRAAIRVRKVQ